jgi:hypothetical protein
MRIYKAVAENLEAFHAFFRDHLLPVQERHGARLVGRWVTTDDRVVAVWEYDSVEEHERIAAAVSKDPDAARAQVHRASLGQLFTEYEEIQMRSTV